MNNQYSLKISALKHVGNVSVNSKPDHPPLWQDPWETFLMGEFHIIHPLGYKTGFSLVGGTGGIPLWALSAPS